MPATTSTAAAAAAPSDSRPAAVNLNRALGGVVPVMHYFDLPIAGRGGGVALFLRSAGVAYTQQLTITDDWQPIKEQLRSPGGANPLGHLPLLYGLDCVGSCPGLASAPLVDSQASTRYVARLLGWYGVDAQRDYMADVVGAASVEWRTDLLSALFGPDPTLKPAYLAAPDGKRLHYYAALEELLTRFGAAGATTVAAVAAVADASAAGSGAQAASAAEGGSSTATHDGWQRWLRWTPSRPHSRRQPIASATPATPAPGTYADGHLFSVLYDDVMSFGREGVLPPVPENGGPGGVAAAPYPKVAAFYEAFSALPAVAEWIQDKAAGKARAAAAAAAKAAATTVPAAGTNAAKAA